MVDAGAGADVVDLADVYGSTASVTLGAGRDLLRLGAGASSSGASVIEDFAVRLRS